MIARHAILIVASIIVVGCSDTTRPVNQSSTSSPPVQPSLKQHPTVENTVSTQKSIEFWKRTQLSPGVAIALTDPVFVTYEDGTEINQFEQISTALRRHRSELLKISTVGVHADLVEWHIKACVLLELQAIRHEVYSSRFKRYVHPFGGLVLASDSLADFAEAYSKGDDFKSAAGRSFAKTFASSIQDVGSASEAFAKMAREVAREKYEVRARVSNQLGIDLPLQGEGSPIVTFVTPDSLASKAGLQVGDILLSYDNTSLDTESYTVDVLETARIAAEARNECTVKIVRGASLLDINVPSGVIGFEFTVAPPNLPTPWDIRYYLKPKGWTDPYPYETKVRKK